jgi:glycosyltransferase involved in cell wall biosynthesis
MEVWVSREDAAGVYPIRVAQVMGKMLGGGVEAVVMNYYRHIDRNKVQFDFLVDADSTLVPRDEIESLGGRVFVIPPYQNQLAYQRELGTLFREQRWPIVHSHVNALSVFSLRAAKKAGVPVRIAHSHSTANPNERAKTAVKNVLRTQANRYPTDRFACGEYAGTWLFGKDVNFTVMPNAIDLSRFAFSANKRGALRSELGIEDATFVVLHMGRFVEQKNHRFLVEVFTELLKQKPNAMLLLAGNGPLRKEMEGEVASRGISDHVRFLGQRSDADALYCAADVFCLPSLYEGLPVVAVEAQAAGLSCTLSDRITREADVTGTCQFLPIDDPDVWADALCSVEPKTDAERAGIDHADFANYDIEKQGAWLTERYLELYKEVS